MLNMPITKGRRFDKCSKTARCRRAWLSKFKQLDSSIPTRSSSSSELSNTVEELFINSLNLTTVSSSSNTTLHNLCASQQKIMASERRKNNVVADSDEVELYQVIRNSFLLDLMKNIICIGYKEPWNEKIHISKKEGINYFGVDSDLVRVVTGKWFIFILFSHLGSYYLLVFTCKKCKHKIQINTSKMISNTKHRDINIRVQLSTSVSDSNRKIYLSYPVQF